MKVDKYILEAIIRKEIDNDVYLTTVKDDPKKYVTQVYKREEIEHSERRKYLENEITILRYLDHPHIIKLLDIKKSKKNYYLIFEYCNGGALSEALTKYIEKYGKPFPEEIIQHLMRQVIDSFKYIHEKKIIHRDISLYHILLNYENEADATNLNLMKAQIKIAGFNYSCRISKNGLKYSFVGTEIENKDPLFLLNMMNPSKKARPLGYNEKADIWSIGSICYELLIGKPVFDAENFEDYVEKIEKRVYYIPTTLSYEAISFINGMLQYENKKRLSASQLSRHDFLNKEVNKFKKINLEKVSNKIKVESGKSETINNKDSTIWSIFNEKDESLLSSILGTEYIKPIDKKEVLEFSKVNLKESSVKLPPRCIPDNPIDVKITGMSKEEFDEMKKNSKNNLEDNPLDGNNIMDN